MNPRYIGTGGIQSNVLITLKKLKPSQFHRRNVFRITIGNLFPDQFYTQISEFGGSCEFFHKKGLTDVCIYCIIGRH